MIPAEPADDVRWVRIVSWHIAESEYESRGGRPIAETVCGRKTAYAPEDHSETLPLGARSCESCLRIALSRRDWS